MPTTDTITASGTWTVPANVLSVDVECWGSGGGGGYGTGSFGGNGGGGGAYAKQTGISVTPGNNETVVVGAGGLKKTSGDQNNTNGADTYFRNTSTVLAKGWDTFNGAPAASCVGSTKFSGGNGGVVISKAGGAGGGSSAGTAANGNPGSNPSGALGANGGTAPSGGGSGGRGAGSASASLAGSIPGGGGGGAHGANANIGSDGAHGQMKITYTPVNPSVSVTGSLSDFGNVAVGANSAEQTFSVSGSDLSADLVVTAPSTDFQVSLSSGSGFGSSVAIAPSGGTVSSTTIYARFTPQSGGAKSGNITVASTGVTTKNVAVVGAGLYELANLKTINGLAKALMETMNGLATASIKTRNGLT